MGYHPPLAVVYAKSFITWSMNGLGYQVKTAIIIIKALVLTATNLKNNALLMNKAYFSLMERNQWLVLPA